MMTERLQFDMAVGNHNIDSLKQDQRDDNTAYNAGNIEKHTIMNGAHWKGRHKRKENSWRNPRHDEDRCKRDEQEKHANCYDVPAKHWARREVIDHIEARLQQGKEEGAEQNRQRNCKELFEDRGMRIRIERFAEHLCCRR